MSRQTSGNKEGSDRRGESEDVGGGGGGIGRGGGGGLTRRAFVGVSASAVLAGYGLGARGEAAGGTEGRGEGGMPRAGGFGRLDATAEGGIDLYVEHRPMRIAGGVGRPFSINGSVPGPVIHMTQGREAVIRVHNRTDEMTAIHWHGILLPYTMDGVPGISFEGIAAGESFEYRYRLTQSGTYWYHSHVGPQEQRGMAGLLIVEPEGGDPFDYDLEHVVVLQDWSFTEPEVIAHKLKTMEGYYNWQRPTLANLGAQARQSGKALGEVIASRLDWQRMRMDPTDLADVTGATYHYLVNGQTAEENPTLIAEPGRRVRLRVANASALTFYDVRLPGVELTVVQADGQNVVPVATDEFRIAVAETYDVLFTMPDRAVTLFAETMDRSGFSRATIAPRRGLEAGVPPRRMRPMLGMEDMGMAHGMMQGRSGGGGMAMDGSGGAHEGGGGDGGGAMSHGGGHRGQDGGEMDQGTGPERGDPTLPVRNLPQRIAHGPDHHGAGSIVMAHTAYRQSDDPGLGLGDDGWRVLTYQQLQCLETPPDRRPPTRQFDLHLTGNMHQYIWGFDGKKWSESDMIKFQYGERLRINFVNDTMMTHPLHLHGMWMDLVTGDDYDRIPRKHVVRVQPAELVSVDITADAPGQWAFHCHVLYHFEWGMFRTIAVVESLEGAPIRADA